MRIVYIGTVEFSRTALRTLTLLNANIVGVVAKTASAFNADFVDMSATALGGGIPYLAVSNINSPVAVQWIRERRPDVVFCFGFSQLLKKEILTCAPMGVVGYHPAMLPRNRGRHPIVWALALGLTNTGSTFFFMDEGVDSGDILSQEDVPILYADTARTLYDKIAVTAQRQIAWFLPRLQNGTYKREPQDESKANHLRKRVAEDGHIDFRMSSGAIYNLVRALTSPYPGAHTCYRDAVVRVWAAEERSWGDPSVEPGKVLEVVNNYVLVKCDGGSILLTRHEFSDYPHVGDYLQ